MSVEALKIQFEELFRAYGERYNYPEKLFPKKAEFEMAQKISKIFLTQTNSKEDPDYLENQIKRISFFEHSLEIYCLGIIYNSKHLYYHAPIEHTLSDIGAILFTDQGILEILKYLQKKGSLHAEKFFVYKNLDVFVIRIKEILEKTTEEASFQEYCIINIHEAKNPDKHPHKTAAYIEKLPNKPFRLLILDSVGMAGDAHYIHLFSNKIKDFIGEDPKKTQLFFPSDARQRDFIHCDIFAIRDLVEISHMPEGIKTLIPKVNQSTDFCNFFDFIPNGLQFLKFAQTRKYLESLKKENSSTLITSRKNGIPYSTPYDENYFAKYLSEYYPSQINDTSFLCKTVYHKKAMLRRWKYVAILISSIIKLEDLDLDRQTPLTTQLKDPDDKSIPSKPKKFQCCHCS